MSLAEIRSTQSLRRENRPRAAPRRLSFQITNLCNSRCTMCSIWEIYREDKARLKTELSGDEWMIVAHKALDHGVASIDITGGEPFLKDRIADLLSLILTRLGFVAVTTNALQPQRIAADVERVLADAPDRSLLVVSVSIDGFRDTYARIRGVADGFDKALELLRRLNEMRARGLPVAPQVSFTILDSNVHEMIPLLDYLLETGLIEEPDQFTFRPAASGSYYGCDNTIKQRMQIVEQVRAIDAKYKFKRTKPFVDGIPTSVLKPKHMQLPCYAMFVSCWVDPYGGVSPCVSMTEDIVGNVRDADLDILPVWHNAQAALARARIRNDQCVVCWTDCQAMENIEYNTPVAGHDQGRAPVQSPAAPESVDS